MQQLRYLLIVVLGVLCLDTASQTIPYLERNVSISASNQTLGNLFKDISAQTGVSFSYNPSSFNDQRRVSITVYKMSLRLVLDELIKESNCSYKVKKNYVIIYPHSNASSSVPLQVTGYIYNAIDSSVLENTSVYIVSSRRSVITNEYGYFSLSLLKTQFPVSIKIAREGFIDSTLILKSCSIEKLRIYLPPQFTPEKMHLHSIATITDTSIHPAKPKDTLIEYKRTGRFMNTWLRMKELRSNFKNINDTLFSNFSVSFIPYLSTNRLLSINTINNYSFNILVGYSKGVNKFELGGLFNIDNGKVKYGQIAGLANFVSDSVRGVQVAGLFNVDKSHVYGTQIAGVFNTSQSNKGLQLGGVFNISERVNGAQISGIYNHCDGKLVGLQLAGIVNIADSCKGLQLSGIVNRANSVEGAQIAGIYNDAKHLKGTQIGFINKVDTCIGIPIGFISIVKHGYHKLDVSINELQFATIGVGTGVEKFHNLFFVGATPFLSKKYWSFGYGLGSSFKLKNKWGLSTELSAQQLQSLNGGGIYLNLLSKCLVSIDYQLAPKIRLSVGPSFNHLLSDTECPYYNSVSMLTPSFRFYNSTNQISKINSKMWLGGTFSIKFL